MTWEGRMGGAVGWEAGLLSSVPSSSKVWGLVVRAGRLGSVPSSGRGVELSGLEDGGWETGLLGPVPSCRTRVQSSG